MLVEVYTYLQKYLPMLSYNRLKTDVKTCFYVLVYS